LSGVGLVVALPGELPAGFSRINTHEAAVSHAVAVYRHATATELVAVQAGVGCRRAAEGARLLIRRFPLRALVSFGFAGGLAPQLARGTLVIGTALVGEASARTLAEANRDLVDQFLAAAEAEGLPRQRGTMVTTQHLVANATSKAILREKSGASAVDMETAGIVEVACQAGLPWVAVRAIIDSAEDALPTASLSTLRADGHVAIERLLWAVCRSPQLLRHLLRLAADTATARRHLSHTLDRWSRIMAAQGDHRQG
jgi:adenosylhomocysteine nucleosidase